VCVIDLAPAVPRVWPGPPWVRRSHDEPGPAGAAARFVTSEKTAWDLTPWRTEEARTVTNLIVLEPGGGEKPRWTPLDHAAAVNLLAGHAVWLGHPGERVRQLFGPVVTAAGRIPMATLRLPRDPRWVDQLVRVLDDETG
jgi:hypothetical protein